MGADWNAVGEQASAGFLTLLGMLGTAAPLVFLLILAVLVVRALWRQGRYRVARAFDEEDRRAVREAVAGAERKTVGEILPVVVERSDAHPGANWLAALSFVLLGSSAFLAWMPWQHPWEVLLVQVALGAAGYGLARWLPDFKRLFVLRRRATEVVEEQAFQEFFANGLHRTEAATGVLIFVSLLEHRVVILADEGIDSKVDADFWADADDRILEGIRRGSLRDGLIAGVDRIGDLMSGQFPWAAGDRNEIPDRVIVRRQ